MERRAFLASLMAVPAVAGASVTPAAAGAPAATAAAPQPTVALSEARFRALLGERFQFIASNWSGHLQLSEVVSGASDAHAEQFMTVFRADKQPLPAAGLYEVAHPTTGRFALRIEGHRESDFRLASFGLLR